MPRNGQKSHDIPLARKLNQSCLLLALKCTNSTAHTYNNLDIFRQNNTVPVAERSTCSAVLLNLLEFHLPELGALTVQKHSGLSWPILCECQSWNGRELGNRAKRLPSDGISRSDRSRRSLFAPRHRIDRELCASHLDYFSAWNKSGRFRN